MICMEEMVFEPITCIHGFIQPIIWGKNSIIFNFSKCSTIRKTKSRLGNKDWVLELTKNSYSNLLRLVLLLVIVISLM